MNLRTIATPLEAAAPKRSSRSAILAITAGLVLTLAGAAGAQSWNAKTMFASGSPFSAVKLTGPNCILPFNPLTSAIPPSVVMPPPALGFRDAVQGNYPLVMTSTLTVSTPAAANVATLPAAGVLLHPAENGDCAGVRFTAPTAGTGTYTFTGRFYGAYTKVNNVTVMYGTMGNGVIPKIIKSGIPPSSPLPVFIATAPGFVQNFNTPPMSLSQNETVDFAVNHNGNFSSDSTILELIVAVPTTMYPHGTTAVTPGPVNTCAPYRLCFDVNVPNGPLGNGSANLSLQIVNNSVTPPTVIATPPPKTTAVDGLICFDMPALPAGTSYDYVVTTNFTQPVPGGNPLTAQTVLQSPIQGPNNDLVCQGGSPASTCCPPVNHDIVAGMFDDNHSNTSTSYNEFLVPNAPATLNFVNGLASYLAYLKFVCPQIVGLRAEFFTGQVAAPVSPGSPGPTGNAGPLSGAQLAATPANTYTSNVWGVGVISPLNNQLNSGFNNAPRVPGLYYRTSVKITGVNASGVAVNCGFDAIECAKGDSYGFIHSSTAGMKVGPGGATQSKFRTP